MQVIGRGVLPFFRLPSFLPPVMTHIGRTENEESGSGPSDLPRPDGQQREKISPFIFLLIASVRPRPSPPPQERKGLAVAALHAG